MALMERIRLALQRQSRVYRITGNHELSHMPKSVKVDKPVWGSKLKLSANCPSVSTYESRSHILLACGLRLRSDKLFLPENPLY